MYELTLEITNQCTLNCLHCSSRSNEGLKTELSLGKIDKIVKKYKPTWVNISGGEPCVRKDINGIIGILKSHGIKIRLYTTQLFDNYKYVDEIVVSCYSYNRHVNMAITRMDYEPFDLIKKYIELGVIPSVHIVAMSINIGRIEDTCNRLIDLGVKKIKILKLVYQGRCVRHKYLLPSDSDLIKLYNLLKDNPLVIFGNPFKHECLAGKEKMVVKSDGSIIPCESFKDGVCKCVKINN